MKSIPKEIAKGLIEIVLNNSFFSRVEVTFNISGDREDNYSEDAETYFYDRDQKKWMVAYSSKYGASFTHDPKEDVVVTEEEILDRLGKLENDAALHIMPYGTHCGSLSFDFGWMYSPKRDDTVEMSESAQG